MWEQQAELAKERYEEKIPDTILLLEHPSVYTAGKRTQPEDYPTISDVETVDIDRGGRIVARPRAAGVLPHYQAR